MDKKVPCNYCGQMVKPKLEFSWIVVIATLLLFWPATIIYFAYRLNKGIYTCPICELPLEDQCSSINEEETKGGEMK
jgi:hypothetical protein